MSNNEIKKNSSDEEELLDNKNNSDEKIKKLFQTTQTEPTKIKTNEVEESLKLKEKLQSVKNLKFDSDDLIKKAKYKEAIDKYKDTINTLLDNIGNLSIDIHILDNIRDTIIIPCYQNIILCNIKLNKWIKVKTYAKKILALNANNIKAKYRLCLANIKLGHLKKADSQLEDLERLIGGTPELEELEKIYETNKLNSEGNNGEFLRRMGKKLAGGKINIYSDKNINVIKEEKNAQKESIIQKIQKFLCCLFCCCKKKKKKE